jgi:hypothetical protein
MSNFLPRWWSSPSRNLFFFLIFTAIATASAQDGLALSARIVNPDVSYSIVSAARNFVLREDAIIALAAGDTMETSRTGRAYLRMGDALEVLVLPSTRIEIVASLTIATDNARLNIGVDGNAIFRFNDASQQSVALSITTEQRTFRANEGWFALWSNLEGGDVVTVASGSVDVVTATDTQTIRVEEGMLARDGSIRIVAMEPPYNGSRLVGIADGCNGRVNSVLPNLNIRAGTTLGYAEIGFVNDGASLRLIGQTVDGLWYRIQRFSGFGWVLANAIETDCVLPEYPNIYGESNRELFNVEGIELVLLTPFYGNFESDPWFYRWLEAPPR